MSQNQDIALLVECRQLILQRLDLCPEVFVAMVYNKHFQSAARLFHERIATNLPALTIRDCLRLCCSGGGVPDPVKKSYEGWVFAFRPAAIASLFSPISR